MPNETLTPSNPLTALIFLFNIGFIEIHFLDIVDILLVSILMHNFYKLVRGTVALQVFIGFFSLYVLYTIVQATEMELLTAILGQFMGVGMIAVVVLFQQEIKRFLMFIGKTTDLKETISKIFGLGNQLHTKWDIPALIDAMKLMSESKTGAIMILSATDDMQTYVDTGEIIDALITKRLILNIFFKNSPLHDGGVILTRGRIRAARCILPVSESEKLPANVGLRHRAAVGITEINNVLVLIVSEETGKMSVAREGQIFYNLSPQEIEQHIKEYLDM